MPGADGVLMRHVAPGLGTLVAWALFSSPLRAVLDVRRSRCLGSLNPLPFVAMQANCVAWLCYSFLTRDVYVLVSNIPGVLVASFMASSCIAFADERVRNQMLQGQLAFTALLMGAGIGISFSEAGRLQAINVWGITTVLILVVFYSAPLSVLAEVFRSRSAAGLHLPFAVMNLVNGLLWTAYGAAVPDAFIWGPNMIGTAFGALQVALCLALKGGKREADRSKPPSPHASPPAGEDSELGSLFGGSSGGQQRSS